jgi:hypothetical protein
MVLLGGGGAFSSWSLVGGSSVIGGKGMPLIPAPEKNVCAVKTDFLTCAFFQT